MLLEDWSFLFVISDLFWFWEKLKVEQVLIFAVLNVVIGTYLSIFLFEYDLSYSLFWTFSYKVYDVSNFYLNDLIINSFELFLLLSMFLLL